MYKRLYYVRKQEETIYKNNKGVTLVELIVAMAIMIIVGAAMMSFFSYCLNQYKVSNEEVNLQYESQLCWNLLQEQVIDANQAINTTSNKLNTYSYNEDTAQMMKTEIYLDSSLHQLKYQEYIWGENDWKSNGKAEVLSSYVTSFVPSIETDGSSEELAKKAKVKISYECGKQSYETQHEVAIRNAIKASDINEELK